MQRRFLLLTGLFAALALSVAACSDEAPTLSGDDQFPPGSIPVTREIIVPASEFFRVLDTSRGYTDASDLPGVVVANGYEGVLNANAVARFTGFPSTVTYIREGLQVTDTAFRYLASRLVLRVDTAASSLPGPVTLQVYEAAQRFDVGSATWTTAVDTGGVSTPWAEQGGTRGTLLGEGTYTTGDSLSITISTAGVRALADTASNGIIVTTSTPGARVELFEIVLRAQIKPDNAIPDTTLFQTIGTSGRRTTVFTPGQPQPGAGAFAVGGVLSARTLVELNADRRVPACNVGETCGTLPLDSVLLNQVALLLRPVDVPGGFDPLKVLPLSLRLVAEPELGTAAPLGPRVLDVNLALQNQVYPFTRGDSVVEVPITNLARNLALNDTLPRTYAIVSELQSTTVPPTFGVAFFEAQPRLRIIYTLPARRRLP